jgi:hypothetical protein
MKNTFKIKVIVAGMSILFMCISATPAISQMNVQKKGTVEFNIDFSTPTLKENNNFYEIVVSETNSITTKEGSPLMPVYSKTFEFPLGVEITSIDIRHSFIQTLSVEKQVRPVPSKEKIGDQIILIDGRINEEVYNSNESFPNDWFTITTGAGLNRDNEHVLFLSCYITPVRYLPNAHLLQYITQFTIQIVYNKASPAPVSSDNYSLMVITPSEFSESLQPLIEHKNVHGVPTVLVTLDEIYSASIGQDNPEKIKFFIKNAVENWNTEYVLLVGDMKKLPIRVTLASWWERDLLSDLYYADIYNSSGDFCSWDANGNKRFGEIDQDGNDLDGVDLYADVHIGRLPCSDADEVITIVNKIITYEEETYDQIWFKQFVLAGGDTFPPYLGAPPSVYEGEITNIKVAENLPGFDTTFLWASKNTLQPLSFNRAINKGAGFVSYSGHGFEHGWGTYRPNSETERGMIWYFTPYIIGLNNGNKLPIIFLDACLTAKLDFNFTDLQHYFSETAHLLTRIFKLSEDPSMFYPCFAKSLLAKENGGAIATIGSTRTAYTHVDAYGVYGGAGYLNVHFFDSYTEGVTAGEMLTGAQNAYINNVGPDYFTLEEFILLGDPSLMVGGYQ